MTERHVCSSSCNPLEDWRQARAVGRRRAAALRPRGTADAYQAPNTELMRYLRRLPGRCPCCANHVGAQGHVAGCLFGLRSNLPFLADGTWGHNHAPAATRDGRP